MAIGDTINPGLMRIDSSPIERAGQAQAESYKKVGDTIATGIDRFFQNKAQTESADMQIGTILETMTPERQAEIEKGEGALGKQLRKFYDGDLTLSQKKTLLGNMMITHKNDIEQEARTRQTEMYEAGKGFMERIAGPIGSEGEISESNQLVSELAPQAGKGGIPFAFTPDQEKAYDKALQRNRWLKSPLMQGTQSDFYNAFKDADPAVASMAANVFLKQQEPKSGSFTTIERDGKTWRVLADPTTGNVKKVLGEAPSTRYYPTPKEEVEKSRQERSDEFVADTRQQAIAYGPTMDAARRSIDLLGKVETTGGITAMKAQLVTLAESFGFDLSDELKKETANVQAFQAATGNFLFEAIQKTKGSVSEKEMEIFASISPGIRQSAQGNKLMLDFIVAVGNREKAKLQLIRKMERQGAMPMQIRNAIEDFLLKNDLSGKVQAFSEGAQGAAANTNPQAGPAEIPGSGGATFQQIP